MSDMRSILLQKPSISLKVERPPAPKAAQPLLAWRPGSESRDP